VEFLAGLLGSKVGADVLLSLFKGLFDSLLGFVEKQIEQAQRDQMMHDKGFDDAQKKVDEANRDAQQRADQAGVDETKAPDLGSVLDRM
jgi:hypothetical protein